MHKNEPSGELTHVPMAQLAVDGAHVTGRRVFRLHLAVIVAASALASWAVSLSRAGDAWLGDVGGLAAALAPLAVSVLLGRIEATATARAAILQDEFDRSYLGLPLGLQTSTPPEMDRSALRARSSTPVEELMQWYPDVNGQDPGISALAIQRMNLTWDVPQRRFMAAISLIAGIAWFGVGLMLWHLTSWTTADFVLIWMGPSVAVWELSISSAFRHRELATAKDHLAAIIVNGHEMLPVGGR